VHADLGVAEGSKERSSLSIRATAHNQQFTLHARDPDGRGPRVASEICEVDCMQSLVSGSLKLLSHHTSRKSHANVYSLWYLTQTNAVCVFQPYRSHHQHNELAHHTIRRLCQDLQTCSRKATAKILRSCSRDVVSKWNITLFEVSYQLSLKCQPDATNA
jgi:hypothetical protein